MTVRVSQPPSNTPRLHQADPSIDIYSFALSAVSSLLRKYEIDPKSIGRLEVGTETILDKSKSCKSVLMQLFAESGNTNIEGVDTCNACYGGTNALFNAINWVESSAWDGRDAIVVSGDIAIYSKGAARPTGGAGAVAMLVGPNAPIVLEPGLRGSYMAHAYDFYKPDLTSEYPVVDGHFSIKCYTEAVDACYKAYNQREQTVLKAHTNGHTEPGLATPRDDQTPLDRFDYSLFHAPTCKLVAKSYARLLYNDYLLNPNHPSFATVPAEIREVSLEASLSDKNVEKVFVGLSKARFAQRGQPGILAPTMCGNMYTASVYSGLVSLLSTVPAATLLNKRVSVFSYGSGLASTFFSLQIKGDVSAIAAKLDLVQRLEARKVLPPAEYEQFLELREKAHLQKSFEPTGSLDSIPAGAYYLTKVDDKYRRFYAVKA
jgi:hydroxymethylglutaryl-CoA synthase